MDENKNETLEEQKTELFEEGEAKQAPEAAEQAVTEAVDTDEAAEEQTEVAAAQAEEQAEAAPEESDSTFSDVKVESEAALTELLSNESTESAEEEAPEDEEQEMELATYAADCESCATRVFFEKEDLDEEGNLLCPNCNETIEIDTDAIDYYRVEKKDAAEEQPEGGAYVADCASCEAVVHFSEDDIDDEENIICPECGEKIHIETEVLDAYKEKNIEKAIKNKRILKKVLASVCGVVLALVISFCVIYFVGMKSVVKVDGTSVPMHIYNSIYYIENASNYVSAGFNIDENPAKQEYTTSDDFATWDDFLKNQTVESLKLYYGLYNAGKKEGYEMTDKDKESIESAIKSVNTAVENAKLSFEDFMKTNYGLKLSEKEFRDYLELTAYVNSYYKSVMAKDVSEEHLKEIYDANPESYEVVTFRYFYVQVSDSITKEDALKAVEAISKAKDEEQFQKLLLENVTEDRAEQFKDESASLVKDMACANIKDRPVAKMLSDAKSKKYQVAFGLSDDETYAEVAMLIEPRHKSDDLIMATAINEVAAEKGQEYIAEIRDNAVVKSSLGMILKKIGIK